MPGPSLLAKVVARAGLLALAWAVQSAPYVSRLFVYPIKSAAGLSVPSLTLDGYGPLLDRRWMLVDKRGLFLSQRSDPKLALVRVALVPEGLIVTSPLHPSALLVPRDSGGERVPVRLITGEETKAALVSPAADTWFGRVLGRSCRLVRFVDGLGCRVDPTYTVAGPRWTSLNDGFPLLVASEASLAHLEEKLGRPVGWSRFRPNLVVGGDLEPHAEDGWGRVRTGGLELEIVKPCARCAIVTTNQDTGAREREPMRTLATYRTREGKVFFGQNAMHRGEGTVSVGDMVEPVMA